MRVGIDGTGWVNRRGHGRFTRNAVARLVERDGDETYVVYIDRQSAVGAALPQRVERRTVDVSRAPSEAAASDSRRSVADLVRMARAVSHDRPDVFLFPSLYTYFPVFGVPTVVGVHDTIAEDFPELTLPTRRARAAWSAKRRLAMRQAARLFTVSEAARMSLIARFGLSAKDVAVVPEAPDPVFRPRGAAEVESALAPLGLRAGTFFVFAGGISPHKNLEALLRAYAEVLRTRGGAAPELVLAGDLEGDTYLSAAGRVRELISELALGDRVLLPGFVSDETLSCLYQSATAVVLPSLAEGFGLPAVEAAACGAVLVLSDLPAHRETLDGAAIFVAPTDADALAAALARVVDDDLRSSLGGRAREAVAPLTWDAAAERLHELLEEAAAGRKRRG